MGQSGAGKAYTLRFGNGIGAVEKGEAINARDYNMEPHYQNCQKIKARD